MPYSLYTAALLPLSLSLLLATTLLLLAQGL